MNFKISSINLNKFSANVLNHKNNIQVIQKPDSNVKMETLPLVAIPLVAYIQSKTSQNNLNKNIIKEANKDTSNHPITSRTEDNLDALKKAGLKESEAKKYIKSDGYMDDDGKNICRSKKITSFKGVPEDGIDSPEVNAEDMDLDSEYMMNPELEAIYNAPPIDTPEGLVKTIFGELPPGVDIDMDLWSSLKSMAKGLFGSWLE